MNSGVSLWDRNLQPWLGAVEGSSAFSAASSLHIFSVVCQTVSTNFSSNKRETKRRSKSSAGYKKQLTLWVTGVADSCKCLLLWMKSDCLCSMLYHTDRNLHMIIQYITIHNGTKSKSGVATSLRILLPRSANTLLTPTTLGLLKNGLTLRVLEFENRLHALRVFGFANRVLILEVFGFVNSGLTLSAAICHLT